MNFAAAIMLALFGALCIMLSEYVREQAKGGAVLELVSVLLAIFGSVQFLPFVVILWRTSGVFG